MKCPRCRTELLHVKGNICECPQCTFMASPKDVKEFTSNIRKIDAIIKANKDENEYLLDARSQALIRGNIAYLQEVLAEIGSTPNSYPTNNPSLASKLGLMIASIELGSFMSWFVDNCYQLAEGKIPSIQALIPFIFLFQAVILLVVSWHN